MFMREKPDRKHSDGLRGSMTSSSLFTGQKTDRWAIFVKTYKFASAGAGAKFSGLSLQWVIHAASA